MEYDQMVKELRVKRNEEYASIDTKIANNQDKIHFLLEQRKAIVVKLHEIQVENSHLSAQRKDVARRYEEKRKELHETLFNSIEPANKEITPNIAYRLHQAVETALREALADTEGINLEGIRCNYNYDADGRIQYEVNIPKECKTE